MAKIDFSRNPANPAAPVAPVIDVKTEQVPTPVPGVTVESTTGACGVPACVPKLPPPAPAGLVGDEEAIDFRDIDLPRLNLVQKTGELSNIFPPGTILLDQKLVLPQGVELVVLGFPKPTQYVERVEGGGLGNLCDTVEEVIAAGGTTDYREAEEKDIPWYQNMATALILVQRPDSIAPCEYFSESFEGRDYAIALWSMKGSAYTHAAKFLKTKKRLGYLKRGYHVTTFKLTTRLEKFRTGNQAFVPELAKGSDTTADFAAFVKAVLSGE